MLRRGLGSHQEGWSSGHAASSADVLLIRILLSRWTRCPLGRVDSPYLRRDEMEHLKSIRNNTFAPCGRARTALTSTKFVLSYSAPTARRRAGDAPTCASVAPRTSAGTPSASSNAGASTSGTSPRPLKLNTYGSDLLHERPKHRVRNLTAAANVAMVAAAAGAADTRPIHPRAMNGLYLMYLCACLVERTWRFALPLVLAYVDGETRPCLNRHIVLGALPVPLTFPCSFMLLSRRLSGHCCARLCLSTGMFFAGSGRGSGAGQSVQTIWPGLHHCPARACNHLLWGRGNARCVQPCNGNN